MSSLSNEIHGSRSPRTPKSESMIVETRVAASSPGPWMGTSSLPPPTMDANGCRLGNDFGFASGELPSGASAPCWSWVGGAASYSV